MGRSRIAGFTLVELMITIAIVAILLTLGLPSFQGTMRSNRLATSTNELISSISLVRSEALRSRRGAGLCAANAAATACGTDWNQGWMVFSDPDGSGTFNSGDTVVRHVQAHPAMNLTAGAGTIAFNNRGGTGAATVFTLKPTDCPAAKEYVNTLTLNGSGQLKTEKLACP